MTFTFRITKGGVRFITSRYIIVIRFSRIQYVLNNTAETVKMPGAGDGFGLVV